MKFLFCMIVAVGSCLTIVTHARCDYIYWSDWGTSSIERANVDGTGQETVVSRLTNPIGPTLDLAGGKMYWSAGGRIQQANLDGSEPTTLISGLGGPAGPALDLAAGHIYWNDALVGVIRRANLDGTGETTLVTGLNLPHAVVLDLERSHMYWPETGSGYIWRANLDGTEPTVLVDGLSAPNLMALDLMGDRMYWTNQGAGDLWRANLDGSGHETLVTGQNSPAGIALDLGAGQMYWANFGNGDILRANLDGSGEETLVFGQGSRAAYLSLAIFDMGDFDRDGDIDVDDLDELSAVIRSATHPDTHDLTQDNLVDKSDHRHLVVSVLQTWFGDASLDGEFNSSDLVQVFAAGKYETGADAGWADGDWDGSGVFDSSDLVAAFADGGYEQGPRPAAEVVPEPASIVLLMTGLLAATMRRRRRCRAVQEPVRRPFIYRFSARTVVCCVLTSTIFAQAASAETIFFDNFNDGDAEDGMPQTWVPSSGTWDASSGDYVATGSIPRVSLVPDYVLGNTSARTQVRVAGNIGAALAVRRPLPLVGYAGEIRADGSVAIARVDGAAAPVFLSTAVVPFNPVEQDVMLQFDAFGDKLSLWAWRVGDPMPDEPQVVAFDATYPEGPVGLISAGFAGSPSDSTTFRFVHVANAHIPEPSAFALTSLGGCGLLYARRRKRSTG